MVGGAQRGLPVRKGCTSHASGAPPLRARPGKLRRRSLGREGLSEYDQSFPRGDPAGVVLQVSGTRFVRARDTAARGL